MPRTAYIGAGSSQPEDRGCWINADVPWRPRLSVGTILVQWIDLGAGVAGHGIGAISVERPSPTLADLPQGDNRGLEALIELFKPRLELQVADGFLQSEPEAPVAGNR